ncbi:exported hypothetical protein [Gammaproteobacteria bacterium]
MKDRLKTQFSNSVKALLCFCGLITFALPPVAKADVYPTSMNVYSVQFPSNNLMGKMSNMTFVYVPIDTWKNPFSITMTATPTNNMGSDGATNDLALYIVPVTASDIPIERLGRPQLLAATNKLILSVMSSNYAAGPFSWETNQCVQTNCDWRAFAYQGLWVALQNTGSNGLNGISVVLRHKP